jgi:putative Holliday junction resolvase
MRRLGLDIGEKRIGVAVSDPSGSVATPVTVLDARRLSADLGPLRRLVDDYEAVELVVGLPLTMSGDEGRQAAAVRLYADALSERLGIPVAYHDEWLSSSSAERAMGETGARSRQRRGSVDMVAATLVLQGYLDARRAPDVTERDR